MNKISILLFLAGIGYTELIILLVILSIAGFFLWRMLLKYFLKKGQTGINIAAFIVGSIQAPIAIAILVGMIYWIIISQEAIAEQEEFRNQMIDSIAMNQIIRDTTEIDVVNASPDKCKILLENEYVRVIQYSLKPGERDKTHTHPPKSYYVVSGGKLRVFPEGGEPFDADEVQGAVEWSDHVGKHYVENIGSSTVTLLLTEVKEQKGTRIPD